MPRQNLGIQRQKLGIVRQKLGRDCPDKSYSLTKPGQKSIFLSKF